MHDKVQADKHTLTLAQETRRRNPLRFFRTVNSTDECERERERREEAKEL